jgi:hypothetical protein
MLKEAGSTEPVWVFDRILGFEVRGTETKQN